MKAALISVSDKTGIVDFAKALERHGYALISTGGTARVLRENGLNVREVEEMTRFPECLDGRVKTLHPKIFAGVLARRDVEEDMRLLLDQAIPEIDFVVVNLYPFVETIQKEDVTFEEAIENIDIGGPSLLRAAAKNHKFIHVVCDSNDYETVASKLEDGQLDEMYRKELAAKAFAHTAVYDAAIATYFAQQTRPIECDESEHIREIEESKSQEMVRSIECDEVERTTLSLEFELKQTLRYGENPHQSASFYRSMLTSEHSLANASQLQGKALSYNNIADTAAAIEAMRDFSEPTVVALKHQVPCAIGSAETIEQAFALAYEGDPVSIFGGIVAANRVVTAAMVRQLKDIFLEVLIAPGFSEEALEALKQKKNLRVLLLAECGRPYSYGEKKYQFVNGGLLIQEVDATDFDDREIKVVTKKGIEEDDIDRIRFAMRCVKHIKSNAICLTQGFQTVGVGAGQPNRITSVKIACEQAGTRAVGAILASDAFFPFDDCVRYAAEKGIRLIVQPGGSLRDEDSIRACDELGIAMVFTGQRHFKH